MTSVTQAESTAASSGWIFRLVTLALAAACLASFWYANADTEEYRLRYPMFTPRLWNLYLTCSLAGVVAAIAMWNWRRWGVVLLAGISVAMLFLEFYGMGLTLVTLRIPVVLAVVWLALQPLKDRFH